MRILLKITLFPVTLALSVFVLFLRILHSASSAVLNTLSGLLLLITVTTWIFKLTGDPMFQNFDDNCATMLIMALLFSPFGLPLMAGFLIELLDMANEAIQAI